MLARPLSDRVAMALAWGYGSRLSHRNHEASITTYTAYGHPPEAWVSSPVVKGGSPVAPQVPIPLLSVGAPSDPWFVFDRDLGALVEANGSFALVAEWEDILAIEHPQELVKRMESAHSYLKVAKRTPAASRRVLTYLAIARILTSRMLDTQVWTAQSLEIPSNADLDMHEVLQHVLGGFRTARTAAAQYADAEIEHDIWGCHYHEAVRPLWMIRRGDEPVLVLDEAGKAHLRTHVSFDLYDLYRKLGNDIDAAASILLVEPPEHARLIAMRATLGSHMFH